MSSGGEGVAAAVLVGLLASAMFSGGGVGHADGVRGVKAYAHAQMDNHGLPDSPGERTCLDELWTGESGWDPTADNPSSTAYGIPQALTGLHFHAGSSALRRYMHDAKYQIRWGLRYIAHRYHSACAALRSWESRSPHWY